MFNIFKIKKQPVEWLDKEENLQEPKEEVVKKITIKELFNRLKIIGCRLKSLKNNKIKITDRHGMQIGLIDDTAEDHEKEKYLLNLIDAYEDIQALLLNAQELAKIINGRYNFVVTEKKSTLTVSKNLKSKPIFIAIFYSSPPSRQKLDEENINLERIIGLKEQEKHAQSINKKTTFNKYR